MAQPQPQTATSLAKLPPLEARGPSLPCQGLSHHFRHFIFGFCLGGWFGDHPREGASLGFPARGTNDLVYSQLAGNRCWLLLESNPPTS